MIVTGICGSHKRGNNSHCRYFLNHAKELASKKSLDFRILDLTKFKIISCGGCNDCFTGNQCPHYANEDDDMKELLPQLFESNGFLFCSPTYSQGISSLMIRFVHRCVAFSKIPEKNPFFQKPLLNIVIAGGIGSATALDDFEYYQRFLKYRSSGTLGLGMFSSDSEMKDMSEFVDPLDSVGL